MSSRVALRVSAEDFPTPTAISVSWPEAGVVFFVDVCRSQYETAPPSVWMLDQPTLPENKNNNNNQVEAISEDEDEEQDNNSTELFTLQVSKNSSVSFRCSYFVPKIVNNNVLVLLIGDAYCPASSSSQTGNGNGNNNNNNNSPHHAAGSSVSPFFGVCASLLPPPELVRQHGVDAFASFSFAWLCGPEITSMRPAPRVGFACTTTTAITNRDHSQRSSSNKNNSNNNNNTKPNASIWVHGGLPFAPSSNNINSGAKSFYEPLSIFPDQYSDSDTFLLGTSSVINQNNDQQQQQQQHADKYLRKAVTEDFYGMFELKLCIIGNQLSEHHQQQQGEAETEEEEGSVSVYPWIRHPGLPLICHHSISSIQLPRGNVNNNNTNKQSSSSSSSSSSKLYLIIFGGLKLDLWKSQRCSDLLPTFKNNEFTISNTFYIYDVEEENWEWKDAVITSSSTTSENNKNQTKSSCGGENPSDTAVAAALIKTAVSTAEKLLLLFADGDGEENVNMNDDDYHYDFNNNSSLSLVGARPPPVFDHKIIEISSSSDQDQNQNHHLLLKSFLIYGGLRGRFTEKSKEIWSFGTNSKTRLIQCNQQTAPPTINNNNNDNNSNNQQQHLFFLFNRIWAIDLKKKLMWCQKIDQDFFVENNNIMMSSTSTAASPSRNLNFNDNNQIQQGGKYAWEGPVSVVSGTLKRQNRNSRGRSLDFENPPPMIVQMNYPHHHQNNISPNRKDRDEQSIIEQQQREHREAGASSSSPGTTNALMDAFEF